VESRRRARLAQNPTSREKPFHNILLPYTVRTIFFVEALMWSSLGTEIPFRGTEKDPGAEGEASSGGRFARKEVGVSRDAGNRCSGWESVMKNRYFSEQNVKEQRRKTSSAI
jgi:hypothetical protein